METVTNAPACQGILVNIVPLIFMGGTIVLIVLAIRYFIRLGKDVQAIRKLLEDKQ